MSSQSTDKQQSTINDKQQSNISDKQQLTINDISGRKRKLEVNNDNSEFVQALKIMRLERNIEQQDEQINILITAVNQLTDSLKICDENVKSLAKEKLTMLDIMIKYKKEIEMQGTYLNQLADSINHQLSHADEVIEKQDKINKISDKAFKKIVDHIDLICMQTGVTQIDLDPEIINE